MCIQKKMKKLTKKPIYALLRSSVHASQNDSAKKITGGEFIIVVTAKKKEKFDYRYLQPKKLN